MKSFTNNLRSCILLFLAAFGLHAHAISAPGLSCTRSGESVRATWSSVSGADHYVLKRATTPSPSAAITLYSGSGISYTDSSADSATTYYYWVEAWDSSGNTARSSMATVSSGSGGGGEGAFSISASDGTSTTGVVITWSDQGSSAGYRVIRGTRNDLEASSTKILKETVTGTSYTDTTATAGTTYYYWIVAKKTSGYVTSSPDTGYRAGGSGGSVTWSYRVNDSGEAILTGLSPHTVAGALTTPRTINGHPVTGIDSEAFLGSHGFAIEDIYANITSFTVSPGVKWIGDDAFARLESCRSISLPDSVMKIGEYAFQHCPELRTVRMPASLTEIGDRAFMWCTNLTSLTVPPCVTNIGRRALFACNSMRSLKLPACFKGAKLVWSPATTAETDAADLLIPQYCSVDYFDTPTLTVYSLYGTPSPSDSAVLKTTGTSVTCSVNTPVTDESNSWIRHVCTGWTGLGSVPASGTGNSTTFTITEDSLLTWNWKVQNRITVTVSGGSCSFGTQWGDVNATNIAMIVPSIRPYSMNLSGDTEGVKVTGDRIFIPSNEPRNIVVEVVPGEAEIVEITQGSSTGYTMTDQNTYVVKNSVSFSNATAGGCGMSVAEDATVVLYVPAGVTLTAKGANGSGRTGGGAGIYVPEGSTLILTGEGTVKATGGKGGNGGKGTNGEVGGAKGTVGDRPWIYYANLQDSSDGWAVWGFSGFGGLGGDGGGGAGSGIGGSGGGGGTGARHARRIVKSCSPYAQFAENGIAGEDGEAGKNSPMGTVYAIGSVTLTATSGSAGTAGGAGSSTNVVLCSSRNYTAFATSGGGGGGGGGAGGAPVCAVGAGGRGGGGGGGGGSGATLRKNSSTISSATINNPATGGGGQGGASTAVPGGSGGAATSSCGNNGGAGGAGGAAGAAGGDGTLYVSPTATLNVIRTTQNATTHPLAQYTITFNADGGILPSGGQTATATLGCTLPSITVPTRAGYTFGGYYTAKNGGGTQYFTASGTGTRSWDKTEATTLYAKWTANAYSVKFNKNATDASGTMSNESFTYGTAKTLTANAFTRTGYTFDGWATSASGAKVYNDKQSVSNLTATANGTANLYAVWAGKPYAVTLDRQSGSGGSSSVTATYGSAMPTITLPTRTGYTFGGYYTSANGGGAQYYTAAGASARNWDKTAATTLYAKWTANTYAVTLDSQSGSGGSASVTATYGSSMPSITVPTREHYAFGGYYTVANGGGTQYYTAAGASARNWDKTAATTLYAKWEQTQYQISVTVSGAGTCSFGTQWVDVGTTATATVVPSSSTYRIKVLGNNEGVTVDGTTVSIPANKTRNITVSVTTDPDVHTFHVDATNGKDSNDGLSWDAALRTIQAATDRVYPGDAVVVTNGVYEPFSAKCLGVEIRSVEGAEMTIIDGGGTNRCAFLGSETNDVVKTKLFGFTLRNGRNMHGTGAVGGELEDCIVTGNYAGRDSDASFRGYGGGLVNSIATRCIISNNVASGCGGGVRGSLLTDCLVAGNHAQNVGGGYCGGGALQSRLVRCTVADNTGVADVSWGGAGVESCVLASCIVYGNTLADGTPSDVRLGSATQSCFGSDVSGTGNIAADPLFVDAANGDYRLASGSPCINKGNGAGVTWQSVDLDGWYRKVGPYVDMGCYEFSTHREPTTLHVAVATGDDANDGLSPSAPKKSIQSALEWSIDGDTILVNDGVYTRNKDMVVNNENHSRIVTIRSVNGPERTIIDGQGVRRCAKLSASYDGRSARHVATLSGFTITNGVFYSVGGVSHGVVENCIVVGCTGTRGLNSESGYAGGATTCKLVNCLVLGNSTVAGSGNSVAGGAERCDLYNCTVVGNTAVADTPAGGLYSCKAYNCIVVGNTVDGVAADVASGCMVANSCLGAAFAGTGDIVADPLFADAAGGDYRLSAGSPCIGAGDNATAAGETDLAGNTRVRGLRVDMGCYEWQDVPATPVITPADGTILSGSESVVISCATEGSAIYYTTDGSEPTASSTPYRRFRISGRTMVKAVAIKDGLCSEVAVAEYALGQCAAPVITPADGMTFEHSGQSVSIAWSGPDGVLRYTTDGSDPSATSPVYAGPFTIDETTVVKAKAFGDQFYDSAVVTAALTRVWLTTATPAIQAQASFTGSKTIVTLSCATPGAKIYYTTNGSAPNTHSTRYTGPFPVTDGCTVKAFATCTDYRNSAVASFSITKVWCIGDTMGDPDRTFTAGGNLPFFRVDDATAPLGESMRSGAITHNQISTLSTTVTGPGTVSFQWKTSCEDSGGQYDWDHAEFRVDGTSVANLDGVTAWQTVTHVVSGTGQHTLEWRYVKDDVEFDGQDCCWVADFQWTPTGFTETQTTEVPVPYAWLRERFPSIADDYDAYETAAKAAAANGVNKVWECYVAGLDPTSATDRFLATIVIDETGAATVKWTPDLNAGGTKSERLYIVEGKASLLDKNWGPTNESTRFFRVRVKLP